jgi:hypothetical protein
MGFGFLRKLSGAVLACQGSLGTLRVSKSERVGAGFCLRNSLAGGAGVCVLSWKKSNEKIYRFAPSICNHLPGFAGKA